MKSSIIDELAAAARGLPTLGDVVSWLFGLPLSGEITEVLEQDVNSTDAVISVRAATGPITHLVFDTT